MQTCAYNLELGCGSHGPARSTETLTGRFSLMASTGAWKGHEKWCFHRALRTTLSRYCSWLVWRLGRMGLEVSGGGGLPAEDGAWAVGCPWPTLLGPDICAASRPSPMLARCGAGTGADGGPAGHHSFSREPGAGSTERGPLIPLHSSLGSLRGWTERSRTKSGEERKEEKERREKEESVRHLLEISQMPVCFPSIILTITTTTTSLPQLYGKQPQ